MADKIKIPIEFIPQGISGIKTALRSFESAVKKFAESIRKVSEQSTHSEQQWTFLYISFVNRRIAAAKREHAARMKMLEEYKAAIKSIPEIPTATTTRSRGGAGGSSSSTSAARQAANDQVAIAEDAAKRSAAAYERAERQKQDALYRTKSEVARSIEDEVALEKLRGDRVMQLTARLYRDKQITEQQYRSGLNQGAAIIANAEMKIFDQREKASAAANARIARQQAEANVSIARSLDDQNALATARHDLRVARYNEMLNKQKISENTFTSAVAASQQKLSNDLAGIEDKRVAKVRAANQQEIQDRIRLNEIVARATGGQTGAIKQVEVERDKRIAAVNEIAARYNWGAAEITKAHQQIRVGAEKELAELQKGAYQELSTNLMQIGYRLGVSGAAMLAAFQGAVAPAMELEHSIAALNAVVQPTEEEMALLTEQTLELGKASVYSASQVAQGMKFLGQSGFSASEILTAMPAILDMAAAGEMDLAKATDLATGVVRGFNAGIAELPHMADVLAATAVKTNADISDLGESFKYVGPIAASAGATFEDVAASLGIIANAGIKGSMGGTALRQTFSALLAPTKQQAKLLGELGISLTDAQGKFIGFIPTVAEFERVFAGISSDAEKTAIVMRLVGDRAGPALAAMIKKGSAEIGRLAEELRTADGEARKMAELRLDTLQGAIDKLKKSWDAFLVTALTPTLKVAKSVVLVLKDIVDALTDFMAKHEAAAAAVKLFVGVLGTLGAAATLAGGLTLMAGTFGTIKLLLPQIITGFGMMSSSLRILTGWTIAASVAQSQFMIGWSKGWAGMIPSIMRAQGAVDGFMRALGGLASVAIPVITILVVIKVVYDKLSQQSEEYDKLVAETNQGIVEAQAKARELGETLAKMGGAETTAQVDVVAKKSYEAQKGYLEAIKKLKDEGVRDDDVRLQTLQAALKKEQQALGASYKNQKVQLEKFHAERRAAMERLSQLGIAPKLTDEDLGAFEQMQSAADYTRIKFAAMKQGMSMDEVMAEVTQLTSLMTTLDSKIAQVEQGMSRQRAEGNKLIEPVKAPAPLVALDAQIEELGKLAEAMGLSISALMGTIEQDAQEAAAAIALIPDEMMREQASVDNSISSWRRRHDLIMNSDASRLQTENIKAMITKLGELERSETKEGENYKNVLKTVTEAAKDAFEKRKSFLLESLKTMTAKEEEHAKKVMDLQNQITKAAIDAQTERERMSRPSNLTPDQSGALDIKQLEALYSKWQDAVRSGNVSLASELAGTIKSLASSTVSSVQGAMSTPFDQMSEEFKRQFFLSGGESAREFYNAWQDNQRRLDTPLPTNEQELNRLLQEEVNTLGSMSDKAKTFWDDVTKWQQESLQKQKDGEQQRLNTIKDITSQIKTEIQTVNDEMTALFNTFGEEGKALALKIESKGTFDEAKQRLKDFQQDVDKRMTLKVAVDLLFTSSGGTSDFARFLAEEIKKNLPTGRRWGGPIEGKISGYGGGDRVRALLERGEYVVRKEAVGKYGPAFFDAVNTMKFASGGLVSFLHEIPRFAAGGKVPEKFTPVNIPFFWGNDSVEVADMLRSAIKEKVSWLNTIFPKSPKEINVIVASGIGGVNNAGGMYVKDNHEVVLTASAEDVAKYKEKGIPTSLLNVATHELVHAFLEESVNVTGGFGWTPMQEMFGDRMILRGAAAKFGYRPPSAGSVGVVPHWFSEGLAEYLTQENEPLPPGLLSVDVLSRIMDSRRNITPDATIGAAYGVSHGIVNEMAKTGKMKEFMDKLLTGTASFDKLIDEVFGAEWKQRVLGAGKTGFAEGGFVPGYGGGDKVRALLEKGEYVLRKEAVARYGRSFIDALNGMVPDTTQRFAAGGMVGEAASGAGVLGSYKLDLSIGGKSFPLFGAKDVVEAVIETLRREGATT